MKGGTQRKLVGNGQIKTKDEDSLNSADSDSKVEKSTKNDKF